MNEHDRANLEFLLKSTPEVLKDWFDSVEEDDILYAQELLESYKQEIEELVIEEKLNKMGVFPEVLAFLDDVKQNFSQ